MILIDAGPLVAMIDAADEDHEACHASASRMVDTQFVVTWPCFTEAMYLLGREGGYKLQASLWRLVEDGVMELHTASEDEIGRMADLMSKFQDTPMDLADASVVAAYETSKAASVFTLDRHFFAYRTASGDPLNLVVV